MSRFFHFGFAKQKHKLRRLLCDVDFRFYFSRPIPPFTSLDHISGVAVTRPRVQRPASHGALGYRLGFGRTSCPALSFSRSHALGVCLCGWSPSGSFCEYVTTGGQLQPMSCRSTFIIRHRRACDREFDRFAKGCSCLAKPAQSRFG